MQTIIRGQWQGTLGSILSPRELEFLLEVAAGKTDKQIAREVGLAPDTVRKRIYSAMFKLKANRRAQLIAEAIRRSLIAPLMVLLAVACASAGTAGLINDQASNDFERAHRLTRMRIQRTGRRDDLINNPFDV